MSCKVGNQTNSQDPQAVNSRVFVGNLNTFQCSKTDVERMFQRYGRIAGISMHKGYAFIQFTNPFDARSACLGEDGRLIWGQTLDVNMVAEPKAHQTGRKRQNIAKTGNDWDYYYDSYYAQVGFPTPRLVPPMKRARLHVPATATPRTAVKPQSPNKPFPSNTQLGELKSYSTPDILICGNCRELFSEIEQLMEHKKTYCKLRFTCKCHMLNGCQARSPAEEPASLLCSQCKDSFHSAWDLMVHVQAAHMLNIYQLSTQDGAPSAIATNTRDIHDLKEENGSLVGTMLMEGSKSLGVGTNGNGSICEETGSGQSGLPNLPISHHSSNNSLGRETSPSSTSTSDAHSPNGPETGSSFGDSTSEHRTPERALNGIPCGTFTNPTTITRAAFPMEASTQTQTIHTDNPQGFKDHSAEEGLTHFA